jgi:hypothetical protein
MKSVNEISDSTVSSATKMIAATPWLRSSLPCFDP